MTTTDTTITQPLLAVVTVRGGAVADVRSNGPLILLVEDWDCTDQAAPALFDFGPTPLPPAEEEQLLTRFDLGAEPRRSTTAALRFVLKGLIAAAEDLDAAMDGATDQFDDERARLDGAVQAARTVLDAGGELDIHDLLADRKQIAAIWSIEDVQEIRPDLTEEQAWEVLEQVGRKHDAGVGINWYTLEYVAEDLFGDAPKVNQTEEA